jgi:hypothetical protein
MSAEESPGTAQTPRGSQRFWHFNRDPRGRPQLALEAGYGQRHSVNVTVRDLEGFVTLRARVRRGGRSLPSPVWP